MPDNVYIDMSKAFGTRDHEILFEKLQLYGVCDSKNNLFRRYLSNRYQYIDLNGSKSLLQISSQVQGLYFGKIKTY